MFISVFLSIYGGAHTLVFFKLKTALGLQGRGIWILLAFLSLMVLAPFAERMLEKSGAEMMARGVAYVGYVWMGLVFFLLTAYGCISAGRGMLFLLGKAAPQIFERLIFPDVTAVWVAVGAALLITSYGHFEAGSIRTERVSLPVAEFSSRLEKTSLGLFNLQLSGHTHQGQIFPFVYLTRLAYSLKQGLTVLGPKQWSYVSRGTGTWGPPIRFLAPPEVTVFELEFKPEH
jgi:hypothetical protein